MEHLLSNIIQENLQLRTQQNMPQTISTHELLLEIKATLEALKLKINQLEDNSAQKRRSRGNSGRRNGKGVVEGVFDGTHVIGADGNRYEVPQNYASKSKLVEGDIMQVIHSTDGRVLFKQLEPVESKTVVGCLKGGNGEYTCQTEDKCYRILSASVAFFRAREGDKMSIIVPIHGDSAWAAVEGMV